MNIRKLTCMNSVQSSLCSYQLGHRHTLFCTDKRQLRSTRPWFQSLLKKDIFCPVYENDIFCPIYENDKQGFV